MEQEIAKDGHPDPPLSVTAAALAAIRGVRGQWLTWLLPAEGGWVLRGRQLGHAPGARHPSAPVGRDPGRAGSRLPGCGSGGRHSLSCGHNGCCL